MSILNLNCQSIKANFDKLQIFLRCISNDINPIHVITLQESWGSNAVDMKLFHIPDYTMLYDDSRLSKHGGLITYVHDSFAVDRLDKDNYHQNSAGFESMILKIHKKANVYKKYTIGNIALQIPLMSFCYSIENLLYFLINCRQIHTNHIFVEILT